MFLLPIQHFFGVGKEKYKKWKINLFFGDVINVMFGTFFEYVLMAMISL